MSETAWWVHLGYPPFDPGEGLDQGFPDPGQVVKHFRTTKLIVAEDGSTRSCRQIDLAHMLGVTEGWIRAMELSKKGLDSISRRKALILTLGIPPILLGLTPISDLANDTNGKLEVTETTLHWLQDSLVESWELYYTSTSFNVKDSVDRKIEYLHVFVSTNNERVRTQLLALQCRFNHLAARIACDQTHLADAYEYLRSATKIAEKLGNSELLAASYFWRGRAYLEQERYSAAVTALDKAQSYAATKGAVPLALQGAILLENGLSHAYTAASSGTPQYAHDQKLVLDIFAKAKTIVQQVPEQEGNFVRLNMGRYHHFNAEAYIALSMPDDALRVLDLADQYTPSHFTRRKAYINILRAQAAISSGDYPYAAQNALEALKMCKAIDSGVNLDILKTISVALGESPYGTSEVVGKLQVALMKI